MTEAEQSGEQDGTPASLLGSLVCPHVLVMLLPWEMGLEARMTFTFNGIFQIPSWPLPPPSVSSSLCFHRCQANVLQQMTGAGIARSPASWRAQELSSPKPPTDGDQWEMALKVPRMLRAAAPCNTHHQAVQQPGTPPPAQGSIELAGTQQVLRGQRGDREHMGAEHPQHGAVPDWDELPLLRAKQSTDDAQQHR